jgi:Transposase IS4
MADPMQDDGNAFRHPDSDYSPSNIQQQPIDVAELLFRNYEPVGTPLVDDANLAVDFDLEEEVLEDTQEPSQGLQDISQLTQVTETQVTETQVTDAMVSKSPRAKRSRVRFSYAGKRFKASSTLYLNPTFEGTFRSKFPNDLELTGKIRGCPSKKNDNVYDIVWETKDTGVSRTWLLSKLENTQAMKETLQTSIIALTENERSSRKEAPVPVSIPTTAATEVAANLACASSPAAGSESQVGENGTPPAEIRAARYSALKTSCSQRSVSSVSCTLDSSGNTSSVGTRQSSTNYDSDSDDGDDLDEEDNAYFLLPEGEEVGNSDDEYEEQATDARPSQAAGETYGKYVSSLYWKFKEVQAGSNPFENSKALYVGETRLRPGVSTKFETPFECFQTCGGCDSVFVALLAQHSNDYMNLQVLPQYKKKNPHGLLWKEITLAEMYRFLGILLKISLAPIDGGGYPAYFRDSDQKIAFGSNRGMQTIPDSKGFAQKYMSLARFKQIRQAFHPESKAMASGGGDKCYQLRRAINTINTAAKWSFIPGRDLAFDEGGVACRSRFCPVRQYNKDKPSKFRVDFFILACSTTYCIFHLDVYQGRNATNVGIAPAIQDLPTTQKATMNAIMAGIGVETAGARHLALDNRYQCPELAALLLTKCNVYSTGTVRKNRKGWDSELMNLKPAKRAKGEDRGAYKLSADEYNHVLAAQWVDSKVVSMVSSFCDTSIGTVDRRVGQRLRKVACPCCMIKYQRTMFGVDKGDQMRVQGGGFALKAHFQKWYKKQFFGILDCMLLNSLVAWNLAASERSNKTKIPLKRHEFMTSVAQTMLEYKDDIEVQSESSNKRNASSNMCESMRSHKPTQSRKRRACTVCQLEVTSMNPSLGTSGLKSNVSFCDTCGCWAHAAIQIDSNRRIHKLPEFQGMSCFDIMHSKEGLEIWPIRELHHPRGPRACRTAHPVVQKLRVLHGRSAKKERKKKATVATSEPSSDDETTTEINSQQTS